MEKAAESQAIDWQRQNEAKEESQNGLNIQNINL
jgi:hypothetical protein